jgi:hypothetical protein
MSIQVFACRGCFTSPQLPVSFCIFQFGQGFVCVKPIAGKVSFGHQLAKITF